MQLNMPEARCDCHDRDVPPQPSHIYLCLLTVQTPPKQSLTKPKPISGLPDPSTAFPNPSAAFPKGMLHQCLLSKHSWSSEHHSQTHLTIPDKPGTSQIPSTNPELARLPLNPKTQYVQPRSGKARTLSSIPDWVLFLFPHTYYYLPLLTLVLFPPVIPFLCQFCTRLVLTIPSRTLTHPVITTYDYTQTTPSRSPSLVLPSISSLCTLCISQSEYHLRYSLLWSDPVHVLSLTHPQLAHLWPSSSSMTSMPCLHPLAFNKARLM